jgi:hypothetical protein
MNRVFTEKPPLLWEPISENPLEVRLANMRAAITAGADPNELDGPKKHRVGRPLHYALCNSAFVNYKTLMQNLPIVELLLESGADPRLLALSYKSPIDDLSVWLKNYEVMCAVWTTEDLELKPLYEAAYKAMKKVADKLDGESA